MAQPSMLTDPYGLRIEITDSLCGMPAEAAQNLGIYNDYRMVIERPAFIIDLTVAELPTRYYCRSIGWGTKLLIRVEKVEARWLANHCTKNPSDIYLNNLASQGSILSPYVDD
ncbi:MAG: hypothetical protein JWP69_2043 [Flaviaesturariibacter sp.]|nr:hypothetical protein [Flaviaesturariibacter sp.]